MPNELTGKHIAIMVEKLYDDREFWYPYLRMKEAGAEVTIVGSGKGPYAGKAGIEATEDVSADQVNGADFDAVIIPGGYSPDHMRRTPAMVEFVRQAGQTGRVVAAVCHGPWMLASAGLCKGRTVTGFFSIKDDLINAGAEYVDMEVVNDRGVITSRNPNDLPAFCRTIIEELSKVLACPNLMKTSAFHPHQTPTGNPQGVSPS